MRICIKSGNGCSVHSTIVSQHCSMICAEKEAFEAISVGLFCSDWYACVKSGIFEDVSAQVILSYAKTGLFWRGSFSIWKMACAEMGLLLGLPTRCNDPVAKNG